MAPSAASASAAAGVDSSPPTKRTPARTVAAASAAGTLPRIGAAAPPQAVPQPLPRPGQPPRDRPARPAKFPGRLLVGLPFEAAQDHRQPILVRQPAHLAAHE